MIEQKQWLSDLGARLRDERQKRGLTQKALASKAKTKQDYVAQLERGTRNPSLRTFMNILTALDISADYLIYGLNKSESESMTDILNDFISFLLRRNAEDVSSYYEIVRFMSKYVDKKSE